MISGVIDAVFETASGLLIADYKTDNIDAQSASIRAQNYASQLAVYKEAIEKLMPAKAVRCAVIFLRTGQIIDVKE